MTRRRRPAAPAPDESSDLRTLVVHLTGVVDQLADRVRHLEIRMAAAAVVLALVAGGSNVDVGAVVDLFTAVSAPAAATAPEPTP